MPKLALCFQTAFCRLAGLLKFFGPAAFCRLPGLFFTGVQLPVAGFFMTAPAFTSCSAHSTDETAVPELLDTLSTSSSSTPDNSSAATIKMGCLRFQSFCWCPSLFRLNSFCLDHRQCSHFLGLLFFFSGVPFPGCFFSGVPFPGCCPLIVAMTSSTEGCVFSPVFMFLHFRKAKCRISAMQLRIELISAMVSLPLQAVFQAFLAVFLFNLPLGLLATPWVKDWERKLSPVLQPSLPLLATLPTTLARALVLQCAAI